MPCCQERRRPRFANNSYPRAFANSATLLRRERVCTDAQQHRAFTLFEWLSRSRSLTARWPLDLQFETVACHQAGLGRPAIDHQKRSHPGITHASKVLVGAFRGRRRSRNRQRNHWRLPTQGAVAGPRTGKRFGRLRQIHSLMPRHRRILRMHQPIATTRRDRSRSRRDDAGQDRCEEKKRSIHVQVATAKGRKARDSRGTDASMEAYSTWLGKSTKSAYVIACERPPASLDRRLPEEDLR